MSSPIDFLLWRFGAAAKQEAIIWRGQTFNYQWLHHQILYWTQKLRKWGIQSGQVVLLEADFSPNAMALFLALTELGVILVPMTESIAHKKEEFSEIAQGEILIQIDEQDNVNKIELRRKADHELYQKLHERKQPGLVLFSSGSTGTSKAALHDLSLLLRKYQKSRKVLKTLTFLLFDHIGGIDTFLYNLANTSTVVTVPDRSPKTIFESISKYGVEVLPVSPTFLRLCLLTDEISKHDLTSLRYITYGTEPMPDSVLEQVRNRFPNVTLLQKYGTTEIGTLRSKSKSNDSLWLKIGGEGFETRVVDGLLEIRAKSAMLGYLNAPSPFTEDGWFQTGDEVEVDGEWLRILGRRSEIINVGGEKVYPAVVEGVLQEMEGVVDVAIRGESHPITGMIVCAKVQVSTGESVREFRTRMRNFCKDRLQPFQTPVKIEITQEGLHGARFKKMRRN